MLDFIDEPPSAIDPPYCCREGKIRKTDWIMAREGTELLEYAWIIQREK